MSKHEQNNNHDRAEDGPMVLAHDAVKGYRPIFYICFAIGMLYLAFVFWRTW